MAARAAPDLVRAVAAITFPVTSPLFVNAVGRMGALKLIFCAVDMAEDFVGAVLTVRMSVAPAVEMEALAIVTSSLLN